MNTTTTNPSGRTEAIVCQRFTVIGMTCGHCEHASHRRGRRHRRASPASPSTLATGTVITESVETLPLDVVAAAVDDAGYELAR